MNILPRMKTNGRSCVAARFRLSKKSFQGFFDRFNRRAFGKLLFHMKDSVFQLTRSLPQKNRATVPGPVWLPMVVPIL